MKKKSNDISYGTTEPISMNFKFSIYMMVIQDLAEIGDDLKFKMAVMPIYGENYSDDFFSSTTGLIWLVFCMKHMGHFPI